MSLRMNSQLGWCGVLLAVVVLWVLGGPALAQDCNENGIPDEDDLGEYYYVGQCGEYGTGPGQLDLPLGVAVDSAGFLYVCDLGNHRILKFDSNCDYVDD